jgi:hypothetical protein
MKKAFLLFIAFSTFSLLFAAKTPAKLSPLYAKNFMIPVGNKGQSISLLDLSTMSVKDLEALTEKKMNLVDKVSFRVAQHKLRMSINNDGTINNKKLEKEFNKANKSDVTSGFHLGGFALGFLLSLIGVLIAYLINDDKKAARVKWAWIGFAVSLVLWLLLSLL